jgi:hypothetical protein
MFIRDFHSKLVSGKEEGKLFEALRKLKSVENPRALVIAEEPAAWSVWTTDDSGSPLATAKA